MSAAHCAVYHAVREAAQSSACALRATVNNKDCVGTEVHQFRSIIADAVEIAGPKTKGRACKQIAPFPAAGVQPARRVSATANSRIEPLEGG